MKAARLVVLGVAIAAGGLAALLAGGGSDEKAPPPAPVVQIETVDVLVAQKDIGMGHSITPGDMKWQMWPTASAGPGMIRKTDKPNAMEEFNGAVVRGTFQAGEPIQEAKLIRGAGGYMAAVLPKGMRAISTEIAPETAAAGFILPGDHVDVILSRNDRASTKIAGYDVQTSETILQNVRVLAIDQTVEEKNGQKVVVGKTATLELNPRQAEKLALSRQRGVLSLALRSIADASGKAEGGNEDNGGDDTAINVIRFGIAK
jgi:pilus assembly protein CpaB